MSITINMQEMLDACAEKPPYPSCFVFRSVRDTDGYDKKLHTAGVFKTIKDVMRIMGGGSGLFQNITIDDDGQTTIHG